MSLGGPITEDDFRRGRELADFLAVKRWTRGEAKTAMAIWYEGVGMPREYGLNALESDLNDFAEVVGFIRGSGGAEEKGGVAAR